MGISDMVGKAKDALGAHGDAAKDGVDKAGDMVDSSHVDKADYGRSEA